LCTRADLPAPFAFELFWLAPVQLRRYLLKRFLTDSETLTKILKITLATQGTEEQGEAGYPAPENLAAAVQGLLQVDRDAACAYLGSLMNVAPETVERIAADRQGEPLAILLKAAGCVRADFATHLDSFVASSMITVGRNEELQALFDTLSFNKARILLTYWDWAVKKTGPYAPLH
jgi:hypothetical protein